MEIRGRPNDKTTSRQEEILTWGSRRPQGPGTLELSVHCPPPAGSRVLHPRSTERHTPPRRGPRQRALGGYSGTSPGEGCGPRVAERDSRSTLAQVAQRELSTERVNKLPRHLPPQPQNRLLRTPSARFRSRETLATPSPPQPGA